MPLIIVTVSLIILTASYFLIIRPRTLSWGATGEEMSMNLPGDSLVSSPHMMATRAVTIQAAPAAVWRWIVQIGSGRAGWYSIDWMDNGGRASSRTILPEFNKIEVDYFVPFTPDQKNGMWVKEFQEHEYILWWDKKGLATWCWHLQYDANGATRLMTRLRTRYNFSFPWIIYYLLYDVGDIIMMRKCMLGIKERAESEG